jgi:CRP-like cAMP-binding protein
MDAFWNFIEGYKVLSQESKTAWSVLLKESEVKKDDYLLKNGVIPKEITFVKKGLFSYDYTNEKGDKVIKKFFPENYLVSSTSALLLQAPGIFSVQALEDCEVISYSFEKFRELTEKHNDIAAFYIKYLEQKWVVEKEFDEIALKSETAKQRYLVFKEKYPELIPRLKLHHIASYLAITPTQLSRIRAELNNSFSQHM